MKPFFNSPFNSVLFIYYYYTCIHITFFKWLVFFLVYLILIMVFIIIYTLFARVLNFNHSEIIIVFFNSPQYAPGSKLSITIISGVISIISGRL